VLSQPPPAPGQTDHTGPHSDHLLVITMRTSGKFPAR
jgi:hypothetical protein